MPGAAQADLGEGIVAQAVLGLQEGLEAAEIEADAGADRHRGVAAALPADVAAPLRGKVDDLSVIESAQAVLDGVVLAAGAGLPAEEARGRAAVPR